MEVGVIKQNIIIGSRNRGLCFMAKYNLFSIYIVCLAFGLFACRSVREVPVFTDDVENKNSTLLNGLIQPEDFDESIYKVDNIRFFQKDIQGETSETASVWVVAFHLPEDEYFQVSHWLTLMDNDATFNQDDFYIFKYQSESFFELEPELRNVDDIKCARYNSKFQECLFVRKYDNIVSVFSVTVRDHIKQDLLAKWVQPFLDKIEKRMAE
jgi:hypothetical protein